MSTTTTAPATSDDRENWKPYPEPCPHCGATTVEQGDWWRHGKKLGWLFRCTTCDWEDAI